MTGHRTIRTVLACAVVAAAATGCSVAKAEKTGERAYTVDGATKTVSVDTRGGDIDVIAGDPGTDSVKVRESYDYDKSKPNTEHELKAGTLTLTSDDCGGADTCDVSYRLVVPSGTAVELKTGGGDVTVRGTSGTVDARTSGGDVNVENTSAKKVTAKTDGGNVVAGFVTVPDDVDCASEGGDVDVKLPKGSYAVDAGSEGGEKKVDVPVKASSPHKVTVHSEGGSVSVGRS